MAAEPEDHPDVQVFDEIRYIEHLVRTAIARKLPVGLTYPQFEVMNLLSRRGDGVTPLAIARALQMTKSGLTNTLQRLCAIGLIRVEICANDGRRNKRIVRRLLHPVHERLPAFLRLLGSQSVANHHDAERVVSAEVSLLAPTIVKKFLAVETYELPHKSVVGGI